MKHIKLIFLCTFFFNSQILVSTSISSQQHRKATGTYVHKKSQTSNNLYFSNSSINNHNTTLILLALVLLAPPLSHNCEVLSEPNNSCSLRNSLLNTNALPLSNEDIPLPVLAYCSIQASQNGTVHQKRTRRRTPVNDLDYRRIVGADVASEKGYKGAETRILQLETHVPDQASLPNPENSYAMFAKMGGTDEERAHATHVAGIIQTMAPDSDIITTTLDRGNGHINDFGIALDIERKLEQANTKLDAINYSIGLQLKWDDYEQFYDEILISNLAALTNSGVAVFIAFGNDWAARDIFNKYYHEELVNFINRYDFNGLIRIVGNVAYYNTQPSEEIWYTSNRCAKELDCKYVIFAPGTNILSTIPYQRQEEMTGTSMATPIVVGAYAILRSAYPQKLPTEILNLMDESARKIDINGEILGPEFGLGIVDIEQAFTLARRKGWDLQ